MKASCGKCKAWWTGAQRSHCARCHETFSSLSAFDAHWRNVGPGEDCKDPASIDLIQKEKPYGFLWCWSSAPGWDYD